MLFRKIWSVFLFIIGLCNGNPDAKRLYDDLLSNYNRLIRPVDKNNNTVLVKLGLRLSQLIDLEWEDHKFKWDPLEYGGVKELYVPSEHIWLPDIVLADGEYVVTTMTKAVLHHTGKVMWTPPAIFKSSCEIDVRYFPFDQQTCFLKFGSWSYDGDQIDLKHINQKKGDNMVEVGIDLREYYPSVEWDILGVPAERHERYYPCCQEPYPEQTFLDPNFVSDIFFNITLRRKTLFYTVNLIVPCVGISYLSVLVFYLPADSGEKIALSISILLSQTMFFLLISEIIPSTSLALPLLGKYLLFTMLLVGLSVVITIVILNVHYRKPSTHKMMNWVRTFFITKLPKLLLMRVPKDLLRDLAAEKILGRSAKKNKFQDALAAAEQTNSNSSSPDSFRHVLPDGCNGLHSTTATNRFSGLVATLGAGYNGLPSVMSGLDDSLSDVAPRKKYPFELEKAIHNEDQDWGFVAMVLDRLFLWIFTIASIVGTFAILCEAPSLYDDTKPIDMMLSSVAQQQFLPI
ncbi:Nicotinic acetylcholine receptor alpha-2 subunit [Operophtera brumata]|uniref:Nicotinic acetylcholine receptor alpha-2 subunit n=1 Tax=Operophtera brumata TaxID=104452 RepID=A0A0L7LL34_OPEBR|nr:Nicotinic acetylcholine receptor alpha-2 subunit [Operophtera brumata]